MLHQIVAAHRRFVAYNPPMPEKRRHRGPHPEDGRLFAAAAGHNLRCATSDLSWLLSRGYADVSALKIVGDHYQLHKRQRMAVMRCACSDDALANRGQHQAPAEAMRDVRLCIDGFNVITTVEAGLAGGVLLRARDGCLRDVASMHGSYRKVNETPGAVGLIGRTIAELGVDRCLWYLDQPVSNSGRLKVLLGQIAGDHDWRWLVEVVPSPDACLKVAVDPVATVDSAILDRCRCWFNLAAATVSRHLPEARIVEMAPAPDR